MKRFFLKILGLLSLVKVQNIIALLAAQWIMARVLYCSGCSAWNLLVEKRFALFLLATATVIPAGYIINNFYNLKRDMINRPGKTVLEQQIRSSRKLYLYFFLNFLGALSGLLISWRAFVFFSLYIFLIWLYSHKFQHKAGIHEFSNVFLILYPFFGVMLFFKKIHPFLIYSGLLVALILLVKELIKNFLTLRGDYAQKIETLLTRYGEKTVYVSVYFLSVLIFGLSFVMFLRYQQTFFSLYIIFFWILYALVLTFFYRKNRYVAYNLIKLLIIAGIFSIYLIKLKP